MRLLTIVGSSIVLLWACGGDDDVVLTDAGVEMDGGMDAGPIDDDGGRDAGRDAGPCADVDCSALDGPCRVGVCDETDGSCTTSVVPIGTSCDDGNPCTEDEQCTGAGFCVGDELDCTSLDGPCVVGDCDPATGTCVAENIPSGVLCDDGDACTSGDTCDGVGVCQSTPVDCSGLDDVCSMGACNALSGACESIARVDGLPCDDLNSCTTSDACSAGACTGTAVSDGTACDDGSRCTIGDVCVGGACRVTPVDCSFLDDMCRTGICSPATGRCTASNAPAGTPCSDGSRCTIGDQCNAFGACVASPVDCSALDGPCRSGVCIRATGSCQAVDFLDGVVCDDLDPCTTGDACTSGTCGGAAVPNGTACDDGDMCTTSDACTAGSCAGAAVVCPSPTSCDPTTGACL